MKPTLLKSLCLATSLIAYRVTFAATPIVTALDQGATPLVNVFIAPSLVQTQSFYTYSVSFTGGVRVGAGDVSGDGVADIVTGPGVGGPSNMKVFDGTNAATLQSFFAFSPSYTGGIYVAAGDVNGDGKADLIASVGSNAAPQVIVFSGANLSQLRSFFANDVTYLGGVRVAAGDVDGDGLADIVAGMATSNALVRVFRGSDNAQIFSFNAFSSAPAGGVFVAAGDVDGDGRADMIVGAGSGATPQVKVFSGRDGSEIRSFFAFTVSFTGGVRVAAGDVNGDGRADIITATGPGGGTMIAYSGVDGAQLFSFLPFGSTTFGVNIAAPTLPSPGGTIRGVCFFDADGNGVKSGGEPVKSGVIVFIDGNQNAIRDAGEVYALSASDGSFGFTNIVPGTYRLRQELTNAYTTTAVPETVAVTNSQVSVGHFLGSQSQPPLSIQSIPTAKVVLKWPAFATGFNLESATNLTTPIAWSAVTNVPVPVSGTLFVTQNVSRSQSYYRLRK